MKRVVITGIGLVAPNGQDKETFWNNLFEGKSFVAQDQAMLKLDSKSKVNCKIKEIELDDLKDELAFISKISEEARFVQLGVLAGLKAVKDSGIDFEKLDTKECGTIFASAIGGTPTFEDVYQKLTSYGKEKLTYHKIGKYFYNAGMLNYPAMLLAKRYNLNNLCTAISTGCTGGLDALGLAYETIQSGTAKLMLAGASEAPLTNITYATLDSIGALSVAKGEPSTSSRPFDKERAGFVISEGSGCVVLEELEHALKRGATIYGEVLSYGSSNNMKHMTDLVGDGSSLADTIQQVLQNIQVKPEQIDYINAHGSSTAQNDLYETKAFKNVFGKDAYNIPISSTKSMIGHSLASASMLGIIAILGSIKNSKIHPTANLIHPDPECDLDYVPLKCRAKEVNKALITTSGFGGIHSVGLIGKYVG